jgi:hypothetical protein
MAIHFDIVREGSNFSVRVDGNDLVQVAARVRFRSNGIERFGLSNDRPHFGTNLARRFLYKADDCRDAFGFWADFIEPTAICEGQSFLSLNTYDRARFTFGFGQFAAHVENGDFVRWFRDMLQRPEALDYFPNLEVRNGRIVKVEDTRTIVLESDDTTMPLQKFFNPTLDDVEDAEVIGAAKFIHWTINHVEVQLLQTQHMINTALRLVKNADHRLGLEGRSGDLVCIIMDILHQGRGGFDQMQRALLQSNPFDELLKIGIPGQETRVANLKAALRTRRDALREKAWSRSASDFV